MALISLIGLEEVQGNIAPLHCSCLAIPSTVEIRFTAELQISAPVFVQLWTDLYKVPSKLVRRLVRILLNTSYKLLSRILSKRLGTFLGTLLRSVQSCSKPFAALL